MSRWASTEFDQQHNSKNITHRRFLFVLRFGLGGGGVCTCLSRVRIFTLGGGFVSFPPEQCKMMYICDRTYVIIIIVIKLLFFFFFFFNPNIS